MGKPLIIRNHADFFVFPLRKQSYYMAGLGSLILLTLHFFMLLLKPHQQLLSETVLVFYK